MSRDMILLFLLGIFSCCFSKAVADNFYTAAVFEHNSRGSELNSTHTIETNLAFYKKAAEIAREKGANIIVFPEYGLFSGESRNELKSISEEIPSAYPALSPSCDDPDSHRKTPIIKELSCIAKNNSIYVVANLIGSQICLNLKGCPEDGIFLFNTNLVFDRLGVLMLKYFKKNLREDEVSIIDVPQTSEDPIFKTDFGTFTTFTGSDIMFEKMLKTSRGNVVDGVFYPVFWKDEVPQLTSLQMFESWAVASNRTLLAANSNMPGLSVVGSGIFGSHTGSLIYTNAPDGISKLIVAKVSRYGFRLESPESSTTAVTLNDTWPWTDPGREAVSVCSVKILGPPKDISKEYRCEEEQTQNFTFVSLFNDRVGSADVCNQGMCCSVTYTSGGLKEPYYLGLHNGTLNAPLNSDAFWEEACVLTICKPFEGIYCSVYPRTSTTLFMDIKLKANFTTNSIFPSVLDRDMTLLPRNEWKSGICNGENGEFCLSMESTSGRSVIAVSLLGRNYDRDPHHMSEGDGGSASGPWLFYIGMRYSFLVILCQVTVINYFLKS